MSPMSWCCGSHGPTGLSWSTTAAQLAIRFCDQRSRPSADWSIPIVLEENFSRFATRRGAVGLNHVFGRQQDHAYRRSGPAKVPRSRFWRVSVAPIATREQNFAPQSFATWAIRNKAVLTLWLVGSATGTPIIPRARATQTMRRFVPDPGGNARQYRELGSSSQ